MKGTVAPLTPEGQTRFNANTAELKSDRTISADRAPLPALLATAAVWLDVLWYEIRVLTNDVSNAHPVGNEIDDEGDGDSQSANAGPTAHDLRVERYPIQSCRGSHPTAYT